jgi:hypothetical protein
MLLGGSQEREAYGAAPVIALKPRERATDPLEVFAERAAASGGTPAQGEKPMAQAALWCQRPMAPVAFASVLINIGNSLY